MSFWYLASPYSGYEHGLDAAYKEVAKVAARLTIAKIPIFCPIIHSHSITENSDIDPLDFALWMEVDSHFTTLACGLIVLMMPGWLESKGVQAEIKEFEEAGKPIVYMKWSWKRDD